MGRRLSGLWTVIQPLEYDQEFDFASSRSDTSICSRPYILASRLLNSCNS
jgi:hypothetical protein